MRAAFMTLGTERLSNLEVRGLLFKSKTVIHLRDQPSVKKIYLLFRPVNQRDCLSVLGLKKGIMSVAIVKIF